MWPEEGNITDVAWLEFEYYMICISQFKAKGAPRTDNMFGLKLKPFFFFK